MIKKLFTAFFLSAPLLVFASEISDADAVENPDENMGVTVPVKRPLVEEFTGLWCAFCPRGFVALEELAEEYGESFIAISYHSDDLMQPGNLTGGSPVRIQEYPWSCIDRGAGMNPDFLKSAYKRSLAEETNAEVEASIRWTDDSGETIEVESVVTFTEDISGADYKIAHILVADGLQSERYLQNNAFSHGFPSPTQTGKWWDIFFQGPGYVGGLTFNFVAVYSDNTKGVAGSVPEEIQAGVPVVYRSEIPVEKIVNTMRERYVEVNGSLEMVRVVSALIDSKTSKIVNSNYSNYLGEHDQFDDGKGDTSGARILEGPTLIETVYYDMAGRRLNAPTGLCVKVEKMADGQIRTSKVVMTD